ncbi:GntR family transcriptional regulator [Lachnospiraceae bacterium]|uniref:GntR family transcriptional regulator n=1 Tax=Extibacter sp. GGCC_0201 TaxID=2731209 RepID=UPI001AA1A59A|nr:GntR family transcriptional regulator [Extibacter sp. GGCC_0201]MBO1721359.1 GntR family transcriptional regulator [Extibacter sp. GGCC_0201]BDF34991.1 GntR family transcriptional regulator [Lachnospiraceae bacterium]BDF38993.1 GntR family transcriptional regulator [Lachnospiraceae bacterium]
MELSSGKLSKKEYAYLSIKDAIINNELTSDTVLTEHMLCGKYDLSRTPVREALQRLRSEGFVTFQKDKGFFIADMGLEDLLQIYEMREALEGMAAKLCTMRASESTLSELHYLMEKCIENFDREDIPKAMVYDMKFHQCIISASRNNRLKNTVNTLVELSSRAFVKADRAVATRSIREHQQLYDAIESLNENKAESIMRQHIANSKRYHFNRYYLGVE